MKIRSRFWARTVDIGTGLERIRWCKQTTGTELDKKGSWQGKYVLQSCGIGRKLGALIVRYSQKKKWISIVFYCSKNPSIAHNVGTTGPFQVGLSAKCTSPNEYFKQKLKMSHVQVPTEFPKSQLHHRGYLCFISGTNNKGVCNMICTILVFIHFRLFKIEWIRLVWICTLMLKRVAFPSRW